MPPFWHGSEEQPVGAESFELVVVTAGLVVEVVLSVIVVFCDSHFTGHRRRILLPSSQFKNSHKGPSVVPVGVTDRAIVVVDPVRVVEMCVVVTI